jgi:hypothetical protein
MADLDLTGDKIQPAAGKEGDQKMVPLAALEDERGKRQAAEERVRTVEEQNALYRANVPGPDVRRESEPAKEKDLFEGMDEGDVMTVGEFKRIMGKERENFNKEKENFSQSIGGFISEVQMMIGNPDYKEVISKNLPNVLKTKPHLAAAIKSSQNPYLLAYELGKLDPEYGRGKGAGELDKNARKIIDNLEKPQLGGAKGGGGLDQVSAYSNLTDEQLEERIAVVKNK